MTNQASNQKECGVIAVLSVEQARRILLESGLFEACPFGNDLVIDRETGLEIRLIPPNTEN